MPATKVQLSGGTADGRPIAVAASASPGTIIHTAHATAKDEVFLYANNIDPLVDGFLRIEWGGVGASDGFRIRVRADRELLLVVPGLVLSGGLIVRAYVEVGLAPANVLISGFVHRFN